MCSIANSLCKCKCNSKQATEAFECTFFYRLSSGDCQHIAFIRSCIRCWSESRIIFFGISPRNVLLHRYVGDDNGVPHELSVYYIFKSFLPEKPAGRNLKRICRIFCLCFSSLFYLICYEQARDVFLASNWKISMIELK
jgi:hypothetical protein